MDTEGLLQKKGIYGETLEEFLLEDLPMTFQEAMEFIDFIVTKNSAIEIDDHFLLHHEFMRAKLMENTRIMADINLQAALTPELDTPKRRAWLEEGNRLLNRFAETIADGDRYYYQNANPAHPSTHVSSLAL